MTRTAESRREPEFEEAALRLVGALLSGRQAAVARDDFRVVVLWLTHWLSRRYGLSTHDAEDTAVEAIEGVYESRTRASRGVASEVRNPVAYLVWTARNRAIDKLRRDAAIEMRDPTEMQLVAMNDDEVAALLERDASVADVRQAMQSAAAAGDHLAVQVIGVWLNLAAEFGEVPSSRAVGARAQVSHTSVNQVLRRFRDYFPRGSRASS